MLSNDLCALGLLGYIKRDSRELEPDSEIRRILDAQVLQYIRTTLFKRNQGGVANASLAYEVITTFTQGCEMPQTHAMLM